MRLFTALDVSAPAREALTGLIDNLRPLAPFRWSPAANLHITLRFIGDWPAARLHDLRTALRGIPQHGPVPVRLSGVGWFPNPHGPRSLFANVAGSPALQAVQSAQESAMQAMGLPASEHAYHPHVTLARLRDRDGLREVRAALAAMESQDFGAYSAAAFGLYESVTEPGGSVYTRLEEFAL